LVLLLISLGRGWAFNAKTGGPRMACRWGQYNFLYIFNLS
jgi:hypothetical protein